MPRVLIKSDLVTENNKDILEKYVCPKCGGILRDAVQTSCGHWLCHVCAEEIFDRKKTTPYCPRTDCGEELIDEEGRPFFPDRLVRKEINHFSIMCRNHKFGCNWNGKIREFYADHLNSCAYEKKYQYLVNHRPILDCEQGYLIVQGSFSFGFSPEEHFYCTATAIEWKLAPKQSAQWCIGPGQGSYFPDLTDLSPVTSLKAKALSQIHSHTAVKSRLEDHGCKETEEISREDCIEQISSKTGARGYVNTDRPDPRGSDLGFLEDSVAGAVAGGGYGEIGGGRVDDKLMSLVMTKITGIQAELTNKDSQIHTLQDKVAQLETTLSTKMSENEDRDFRLSLMENSNFDGSMVWKIPQFSQRMDDARTGRYSSIISLPFYSSRYGYKMCLRLYILGDGIGKGTHMSLFFVVMKGEFDNILQWPFTHKVTFKLINQCGARDIMDIFQPDPLSSSFQKPKSDMNVASGCPRFVSMDELMLDGFILGDTIFIKAEVDTAMMCHP